MKIRAIAASITRMVIYVQATAGTTVVISWLLHTDAIQPNFLRLLPTKIINGSASANPDRLADYPQYFQRQPYTP